MKLTAQTIQEVIDCLRATGGPDGESTNDDLAAMLQFGVESRDESDGHRCTFCEQLVGGDRNHKCW